MPIHQQFWQWFKTEEVELFNYKIKQESIFDKLSEQLQKVDPRLSFEIGPIFERKREFIISASGIKDAFPVVQSLANDAPPLERWKVTAFRPRRSPLNIITFRGKSVAPSEMQFSLVHNGKTIGIYLFIPGYTDDNIDLKQIAYLFLDEALGEFDVESYVGLIKIFSAQSSTPGVRFPISELAGRFDKLFSLMNSTRQP